MAGQTIDQAISADVRSLIEHVVSINVRILIAVYVQLMSILQFKEFKN